jgi:flagellar biosynthetic protein FliQ
VFRKICAAHVFIGHEAAPNTQGRVWSMNVDQATDLIRHTLVLALTISAPMLLIGLAVGIIVSLLQAVTQIQEQTLTFIPKIAAMTVAAIVLMPWIAQRLLEYTSTMFSTGLAQ